MAKNFYECAKSGGRVITRKTKDGRKIKICYDKDGKGYIKPTKPNKPKAELKVKSSKPKVEDATEESLQQLANHFNKVRH